MKLSVIVPAYNERGTICEILNRVRAVAFDKEIIVVDGNSTDGTRELLREEEKKRDLKVVYESSARGKGTAVLEGLRHASGDIVLIQDADLEVQPSEYPRLLDPILSGKTDVVFGSRFLNGKNRFSLPPLVANKSLTFLTNFLYGGRMTDVLTCYKVFRTEVLKGLGLECQRFDLDQEIAVKLLKRRQNVLEIPVAYTPRSRQNGKKIHWKDGFSCLWVILKYRFVNSHVGERKDKEMRNQ